MSPSPDSERWPEFAHSGHSGSSGNTDPADCSNDAQRTNYSHIRSLQSEGQESSFVDDTWRNSISSGHFQVDAVKWAQTQYSFHGSCRIESRRACKIGCQGKSQSCINATFNGCSTHMTRRFICTFHANRKVSSDNSDKAQWITCSNLNEPPRSKPSEFSGRRLQNRCCDYWLDLIQDTRHEDDGRRSLQSFGGLPCWNTKLSATFTSRRRKESLLAGSSTDTAILCMIASIASGRLGASCFQSEH